MSSDLNSLFFRNRDFLDEKNYRIIPENWCASRNISITIEGFRPYVFTRQDETLNIVTEILAKACRDFVERYKNSHAFDQPRLTFKPSGGITIEIGMMENELYNELKDKEIHTNNNQEV